MTGDRDVRCTPADITCVIPSHGRPEMLERCLRSALAQTEPIGAIVVVTDMEDPEGAATVRRLGADAAIPVTWVDRSDEEAGLSGSRNRGAREAPTRWVSMLDDDDEWAPDYAARVSGAINHSGARVALASKWKIHNQRRDHPRNRTVVARPGLRPLDIVANRAPQGGNITLRADVATRFPYDEDYLGAEDWDHFIRLLDAGVQYVAVPEAVVHQHIHDDHRVSQTSPRGARMLRALSTKHGTRLGWRGRRTLAYKAAWFDRRAARTVPARVVPLLRMLVNRPFRLDPAGPTRRGRSGT